MATKDTKTRTSLPVVLEDIAKRELDKPRTRRDVFGLGKKALSTGLGTLVDKSKVADWIIGDDIVEPKWEMLEAIIDQLLFQNLRVIDQLDKIYKELPTDLVKHHKGVLSTGKESESVLDELDNILYYLEDAEIWWPTYNYESVEEGRMSVELRDFVSDILQGDEEGYESISDELRNRFNKSLPEIQTLVRALDKRDAVLEDLWENITDQLPEIYDIDPYHSGSSRAGHVMNDITTWVSNMSQAKEKHSRESDSPHVEGELAYTEVEGFSTTDIYDKATKMINESVKNYPEETEQSGAHGSVKKKESEEKARRLIDSAADLARRLAAPPTGTVPRQVKPPVQQPRPAQPKIPAPRATMEQPPEQGRGLSNLARMLPAVGRRLPFIAPAATLLRSKPAGVDADVVPPDPLGTGRVYRNYHDYNPRNI